MKRLKILILIFCLTVSIPLAYVVWQTYQSMAQEEHAQLRFFSEALFDEIEKELTELVQREESRAVDEYHFTLARDKRRIQKSPLAQPPKETYIFGYLQNNPDGSFQSPMIPDLGRVPLKKRKFVAELKKSNTAFNKKKFALPSKPVEKRAKAPKTPDLALKKKGEALFAERYIAKQKKISPKSYLGRKSVRKEKISARQAFNISKEGQAIFSSQQEAEKNAAQASPSVAQTAKPKKMDDYTKSKDIKPEDEEKRRRILKETGGFQVEVAPLQSVFISRGRFFVFRRIAINNQIYRQGFILEVEPFLRHLSTRYFETQPMSEFTGLRLHTNENGTMHNPVYAGIQNPASEIITQRTFPAPFDFLSAALTATEPPHSPARKTLSIALWVLGTFMLLGLLAIYKSARTVVDLSERRSQFVSSVTHELKTPLTNIRMYIEMLEQGIAATPEREQDYMRVLGTESTRLSHLINNVLELAKLEKKQRHFNIQEGQLDDVLKEVHTVMAHKLEQEGFILDIQSPDVPPFGYDREVLVQVLVNLIENSVKFGRSASKKMISISATTTQESVNIAVSDTGPGIPRKALKKIFEDFYRVDNDLTRATGGTGIGLALVKKFITAMGGNVKASNNDGEGCTITLMLPRL